MTTPAEQGIQAAKADNALARLNETRAERYEKFKAMTRFEVGKTYSTPSVGSFEVLARTVRRITIDVHGEHRQRGIQLDADGNEFCFPLGRYSQAQVIRADRPDATETA